VIKYEKLISRWLYAAWQRSIIRDTQQLENPGVPFSPVTVFTFRDNRHCASGIYRHLGRVRRQNVANLRNVAAGILVVVIFWRLLTATPANML